LSGGMALAIATVHCTIIISMNTPSRNEARHTAASGSTIASESGAIAQATPVSTTNCMGLRGVNRSEARPPTIRPQESEAVIAPHAAGPPRCCLATTGPSTWNAAYQAIMIRQNWTTTTHSQVCERNSVQPSRSSASIAAGLPAGGGARVPRTASINGTVPVIPTPHTVIAQPGPAAATSSPPAAAPAIWPEFIASLLIELASCNSASGTSCGSNACEAG
jgi:hypothetical protein